MSKLQFKLFDKSVQSVLAEVYKSLPNPLADLNAVMMVAWQPVLGLKYHIDNEGILYVIGLFENEYWGWGPPIGSSVTETHINKLLDTLDDLNNKSSSILYLWEEYQLLPTLIQSPQYSISDKASEYIYSSKTIASLSCDAMKSFRKRKTSLYRKYKPVVRKYSPSLSDDCLQILDNWFQQKQIRVPNQYLEKFRIEAEVCRYAIREQLPLSGVVVYIDGIPEAFSLGGKHSQSCFNCMFEKTNLSLNGLSVFVFSELGEMVKDEFALINAGEDWGIQYLQETKLKWKPIRIQKSYQLFRNEI